MKPNKTRTVWSITRDWDSLFGRILKSDHSRSTNSARSFMGFQCSDHAMYGSGSGRHQQWRLLAWSQEESTPTRRPTEKHTLLMQRWPLDPIMFLESKPWPRDVIHDEHSLKSVHRFKDWHPFCRLNELYHRANLRDASQHPEKQQKTTPADITSRMGQDVSIEQYRIMTCVRSANYRPLELIEDIQPYHSRQHMLEEASIGLRIRNTPRSISTYVCTRIQGSQQAICPVRSKGLFSSILILTQCSVTQHQLSKLHLWGY